MSVTGLVAVWVDGLTYVGGSHGQSSHTDDMADHGSARSGGLSGGRVALIRMGRAVSVPAQVWNLIRIRSPRLETTS